MVAVLVVEDHDQVREVLCEALRAADHETTCVESVVEARRALLGGRFDIIVTDVALRDGNGYELLPIAESSGVPVLLLTGHPLEVEKARLRQATLLAKPFSIDDLLRTIDRLRAAQA